MARRLELRTVELADAAGNPQTLDYGVMMTLILRSAPRGGVSLDDMLKAVETLKPIQTAIEAKADHVVLPDEHWRTLVEKLATFPFAVADPALAEFGLMIRNAPEIGAPNGPADVLRPPLSDSSRLAERGH